MTIYKSKRRLEGAAPFHIGFPLILIRLDLFHTIIWFLIFIIASLALKELVLSEFSEPEVWTILGLSVYYLILSSFLLWACMLRKVFFPRIYQILLIFQSIIILVAIALGDDKLPLHAGFFTGWIYMISVSPPLVTFCILVLKNSILILYLLKSERVRRTFIY